MQATAGRSDDDHVPTVVCRTDVSASATEAPDVVVIDATDVGSLVGAVVRAAMDGARTVVVDDDRAARSARRAVRTVERIRSARQDR